MIKKNLVLGFVARYGCIMSNVWKAANLDHLSPSQLLRSSAKWIFDYLYCTPADRVAQGVSWRAHLGNACHDAMQDVVCEGQDFGSAKQKAFAYYDDCIAEEDDVMRDRLREAIPGIVESGTRVLTQAGFAGAKAEQYISVELPGIDVPVIGYIDLLQRTNSGGFRTGEIKTKGPKKTRVLKDGSQGWGKATLPKKPEWGHVCQGAIYGLATGGEVVVVYAAEHDAIAFDATTCDELKPSGLAEALEDMRQRALMRQNLLRISNDPKVLASITDPDWRHMYQWKIKDEYLERARDLWQQ